MRDKKSIITAAVLAQLPKEIAAVSTDQSAWWMTRRGKGLRLTDAGDQAFRLAEIEFFDYEVSPSKEKSYYTYLLELNHKINCPYYLGAVKVEGKKGKPYIRLFDSKVAMMIVLYGTINDYLESAKANR